jgi:phosphatidate cytidylyltransferase
MGAHGQCILYFTCSSIVEFKTKWFKGEPIWLAIWLIMVVQASDVLQYVCGKLLETQGCTCFITIKNSRRLTGWYCFSHSFRCCYGLVTPFSYVQATLIGLVVCIFGFFGGLVMSAIKRDRGVKDWGS